MTLIQFRLPLGIDPCTLGDALDPSTPTTPAVAAQPPCDRVRRVFFNRLPELRPASPRLIRAKATPAPLTATGAARSRLWSMAADEAALDVALDRMIDHVLALNAGHPNA